MSDYTLVPLENFPDYWINKMGEVYSTKRPTLFRLRGGLDRDGYRHVGIRDASGVRRTMKIHRLMAMTFMGPRPDGLEVCHNNGIKDDCRLVNLRYGTHASNIHDIYIHGNENPPRGEVNGCAKLTETQVLEMRKLYSTGQYSHQAIADMFGVSRRHTGGVINKEFWAHV